MNTRTLFISLCLVTFTALAAHAGPLTLSASFGQPVVAAGEKTTNFLKVSLTGEPTSSKAKRPPVNIAIVLDRSGSMQGDKIKHAKLAAITAVERLSSDDIISIVSYDTTVQIVVPATKARDKEAIRRGIESIEVAGNTALFAGVSKGADELRKFLEREKVNRVILLSDGLANVGPSTPAELADLGRSLVKEGISVSTFGLGLGFNEDLMTKLSSASEGNHAFIESPADLERIFNLEFGDVLSVVAQEVTVTIDCEGFRPVRAMGRDADIHGQKVVADLHQVYAEQEKYLLLESEIPAGELAGPAPKAMVTVRCRDMQSGQSVDMTTMATIRRTDKKEEITDSEDKKVMASAVLQQANEQMEMATKLRDKGKVKEAKDLLTTNVSKLKAAGKLYGVDELLTFSRSNESVRDEMDSDAEWNRSRKVMRQDQHRIQTQQKY